MGGGKVPNQPSNPPAPPSAGETSAQAIQSQIDALPKILAAQQQYGPQFSQLSLDQLKQYGTEFAKAGLDVQNIIAPEVSASQKYLTDYLGGNDQAEYDALRPGLLEDIRSAQSQRGLGAISPLGSIDESVQLQRLKQSLKDRRLNVSLSTAGRVPIGQIPTTSGTGQLVNNVNPDSIFGYQQGLNNFNASIFGTQGSMYGTSYNNATARRGQNLDLLGSIIGAGASTGGALGAAKIMQGAGPSTLFLGGL